MTEINPFELKPVIIAGTELNTRPVEFEYDQQGVAIAAIKYTSTCPKCSQGIEILTKDIVHCGDKSYYSACNECPLPTGITPSLRENFKDPIENGQLLLDGFVKVDV